MERSRYRRRLSSRVRIVSARRDDLADIDASGSGELDGFELHVGGNGRFRRGSASQVNLQQYRFAARFGSFKKQLCSFQAPIPTGKASA